MSSRHLVAPALVLVVITAALAPGADAGPRRYPGARTILIDPMASPFRVHVARMTEVSLTPGGAPSAGGGHDLDPALELPVVEERAAQVRVLLENDGARMMVWLATADLAWSIARPVRLAGRGDAGIWLNTGAPVAVTGRGRRRVVTYVDRDLEVSGTVGAEQVARVFAASRALKSSFGATARDLRVAPGGAILEQGPLPVEVLRRRGAWAEVEYRARYVRVRGWVAADQLGEVGFGHFGTGSGSGIGMSHTERVLVPAGACLFDRVGGQVVGVQLVGERRYAARRDGDWWQVYVSTAWGTVLAWGQSLGDDGAGQPHWERCAPAAPAPPPDAP